MTRPDMDDKFHDECGVFAIADHSEAANHAYLGLLAQQHRGQESAGIVSAHESDLYPYRGMGKVFDVFTPQIIESLPGRSAIGHVRYSTAGASNLANAQPILTDSWRGPLALAHNGNLLHTDKLRRSLESEGAIFNSTSDTEVIQHLLARSPKQDLTEALRDVLALMRGAFSLVLLTPQCIYAARDPLGFRPLALGRLEGSWVVASETSAFDLIGAGYVRDVEPGEILLIYGQQTSSYHLPPAGRRAHCIFEHVYFARPDSRVFGRSVHISRHEMGRQLAREAPVPADIVVPVPDSGVTAAIGYSQESGIPLHMALIRNHYVGRTFIEPKQSIRNFGVKVKLNPVPELLEGKRVILIDDSIVRGTTSRKIVEMVRGAGAAEVHFRISSPPTVSPCHYGIDTPTKKELIAANKSVEEIRDHVSADSLEYLSLEGLRRSVQANGNFCSACFDESYPVPPDQSTHQPRLFALEE
ncbi:MAG TPA: amidophosphoribosyltransferase [Acidobacteriota bacterium]|nr:amidophosphoribosyltransferase [Acidobacteriota bacterium]